MLWVTHVLLRCPAHIGSLGRDFPAPELLANQVVNLGWLHSMPAAETGRGLKRSARPGEGKDAEEALSCMQVINFEPPMKMWNAIFFVAFLSPYLSLVALRQIGVTVCLLCCPRVAFCFRCTVAVQLPSNFRTVFQRIEANTEEHQSKDHDGFRPCTNVADAFAVLESVCSNSSEWNFPVWFVSVDSKKAFDRLNI